MRMRLRTAGVIFFTVLMLLVALESARGEDAVSGIPNFHLDYPAMSLQQYVLGPVCLSLPGSALELSCNPAFLANEEKQQFRLNIAGNDHLIQVNEYRERLNSKDSVGIVDKVLSQSEPVVARASTATWYQRDWWAVGYSPFRGGFASVVRNAAYPEVSAHIYKESELFAKAGMLTLHDQDLQVGLGLRYVDRQFFRKQFDLLDAIGDSSRLKVDSQRVLYAEPGLNYSFDSSWASALSMSLTNVAVVQDGYQSPFHPVFDIGFSTAPPFAGRKLRTSTHYNGNPEQQDLFSRFRWGAIYDFDDVAAVALSLGKSSVAIGANGHIDSVVLGVGWKQEDISPDEWRSTRISTMLFEAGLVF